ncbi:MerR family transcriptional regulator [Brevibacillus porteri]|uniref:MerR family transcriptional regulator n=1 Tax=Brevibacillus porteri TaxID=2126350 RepID=A0ABX5FSS3_9BACL|nr:helix-turn-helix domain-containing protein [Brevibacillus porteri]MED1799211.1 helix-turn-helix domain-containing protein [Brevibacillus porteri]MED2132401.1 helix-turn-helix domain-containing protein [Brevibacillus porteri]MED2744485.1 helix-turn-helix domain-containing protein [Brevibacillus porteri]MED2814929.1 helix-turn-helix domain-containing protein [Brevibacillus porteri]MED2895626.1 helix-turn-helix domain-containing protein [Brevibacillus porteri]
MFKISEFAKISQVSVKTLRYYDQVHLLKPAHTDKFSGYRYYSADQMFQLNRILAYKELGFSLDQIRQMMSEQIPLEQIRGMFRIKQSEIQSILDKEQARLNLINDRLYAIENEEKSLSSHDVILKKVEPQLFLSYRQRTPFNKIPELFQKLDDYMGRSGQSSLSRMVLWHGCEECDDNMDVEAARLLTHDLQTEPPFTVKRLPEIPLMATLIHHCRTTCRCTASVELAIWIERNGYRIKENEPRREICVRRENPKDPDSYVAELQIAVEKA